MNFNWLDIPAMIKRAEFIFEYPMVDRNPLAKWTKGRVTLLGDAAHPMYQEAPMVQDKRYWMRLI